MNPTEPTVWLNGNWQPLSSASVPLFDLGLWGLAATEMMRSYGGRVVFADRHIDRLLKSAAAMMFAAERANLPTAQSLISLIEEAVDRNRALMSATVDIGLSVCITAGVNPHLADQVQGHHAGTTSIVPFQISLTQLEARVTTGQHLVTSSVRQVDNATVPGHIKSRSRLHWRLAEIDVKQNHPNASPLLLDEHGHVTETSTANIFIAKNGVVLTPGTNVLHGVTRQVVLELATSLGLETREVNLTANDVVAADEVFVTSSLSGLTAVSRVNSETIGSGKPGPVTKQLTTAFAARVEVDSPGRIGDSNP